MAKNYKTSSGAKLSTGYKATLWVIGIVLFLAFAFATFCAFGGLSLIFGDQAVLNENGEVMYWLDDEDKAYILGDNGEKIYLSDLFASTLSDTDVSNISNTDAIAQNSASVSDTTVTE